MVRKFFSALLISVLLIQFPLFSQTKLTLQDCLQLAFQHSRMLKVADLSVAIARERFAETRAQQLPSIQLSSIYTRIGKITSFSIPMGPEGQQRTFRFGTPNRVNFDIKLQLPFFTWGRISSLVELSRIGNNLAQLQRRQQQVTVTDQVLRAFFSVLLNKEVVRLHQVSVARADSHLKVATDRFNAGVVPRLELLRAQVQLKNEQSSLDESQGNLLKSKLFLAKMIGRDPDSVLIAGALRYDSIELDEKSIITRALAQRSDLQLIRQQQQLSQNQLRLAQSGNKPNLFLFSGYNVMNGFDPMNPDKFVDNYNAGIQLALPLFDGFATSHKVQQAKLSCQQAQLQEKEFQELIVMQIRQAMIAIKQSEQKIDTQRKNIQLAKEALQVAEQQYRNGLVSSIEVIDAQHTLSRSELLYTQAIFNHVMTKLDLCKAMENFEWFGM